jgi:hypothetical protein
MRLAMRGWYRNVAELEFEGHCKEISIKETSMTFEAFPAVCNAEMDKRQRGLRLAVPQADNESFK